MWLPVRWFLYALVAVVSVDGLLTDTPRNTVVVVGSETILTCRTNSTPSGVTWRFTDLTANYYLVYGDKTLVSAYSIRNVSVSDYDLQFGRVDLSDAGTYTCQEEGGERKGVAAWLSVIDGQPVCTHSTIDGDVLVTCTLTVFGRVTSGSYLRPSFDWSDCSMQLPPLNVSRLGNGRYLTYTASSRLSAEESYSQCSINISFVVENNDKRIDDRQPTWNHVWHLPVPEVVNAISTMGLKDNRENSMVAVREATSVVSSGIVRQHGTIFLAVPLAVMWRYLQWRVAI